MADFFYNNIGVQMTSITRTMEVIYDGPTFLYDLHRLHVRGRFNPDAPPLYIGPPANVPGVLSIPGVGPFGGINVNPVAPPGNSPIAPLSDVSVRHLLSQPQKQLLIVFEDDASPGGQYVWIRSPARGYATDADFGPKPRFVNVTKITGSTDFEVEIIIDVALNECPTQNIVLSHRWTAVDDISDAKGGFLTSRTYTGEVILNTARMVQANVVPDNFRRQLFMPCFANGQRGPVWVQADSDGNRLAYRFTDSEKFYNLTSSVQRQCPGLMDIEAHHNAGIGKPNLDQLVIGLGNSLVRGLDRTSRANAGFGVVGVPLALAASAFDVGLTIAQMVPTDVQTVSATAYGDRTATFKNLESIALAFCKLRLIGQNSIGQGAGWLSVDYPMVRGGEKAVTVSIRVKRGLAANLLRGLAGAVTAGAGNLQGANAGAAAGPIEAFLRSGFDAFNEDIMPSLTQTGSMLTTDRGQVNPRPQNSGGSRGTLIEGLVTQVLQSSCGLPPAPTLYGTARDLNMG